MDTIVQYVNQIIYFLAYGTFLLVVYGCVFYYLFRIIASIIVTAYKKLREDWNNWDNRKSR